MVPECESRFKHADTQLEKSNDVAEQLSLLTSRVANLSHKLDQLQDEVIQLQKEIKVRRQHSVSNGLSDRDEPSDMLRKLSHVEVNLCMYTASYTEAIEICCL